MKISSLPVFVIVSLLFLTSCTLGVREDQPTSTSDTIIENSLWENTQPPREGRWRHRGDSREIPPDMAEQPVVNTNNSLTSSSEVSQPSSTTSQAQTTTPVGTSAKTSSVVSWTQKNIAKSIRYTTDHGKEQVEVSFSITLDSSNTITAVSVSTTSADRESRQYISRFNSAAKSKIIGKKISSLSLSAVGGASDTTAAFSEVISSL